MTKTQLQQAVCSLLLGVVVGFTFVACRIPQGIPDQPETAETSASESSSGDASPKTRVDSGTGCEQLCLELSEQQCKEAQPRCSHFGADGECDQEQSCVEACGAGQLRRESCDAQ